MVSYQLTDYGAPLRRVETAAPIPEGAQVRLRVTACGVCHSDLHLCDGYFDMGDQQTLDLSKGRTLPLTLGHEIVGEVVAIGPAVTGVSVGDRRVVYPWIGCQDCPRCARGDEHLCGRPEALGVVRDGGFATDVLVPHPRYLFDPGDVDDHLVCTYACSGLTAYSALLKVRDAAAGGTLLAVGAGGVGLAAVALARSLTDASVVVADIAGVRRDAASRGGADLVIDPGASDAVRHVREHSRGGVQVAIDFVGSAESTSFATRLLGPGGVLVVVGLFGGTLTMSVPLLPLRQLTVRGSYVGSVTEMRGLMDRARSGAIPPIPVAARPLAEAQPALEDLRAGRAVGRLVLEP